MTETSDGKVWLGTRDKGLFYMTEGRLSAVGKGLPSTKIACLLPLDNGELWIGTEKGVMQWNGAALTLAGIPSSLHHTQALAMIRDRDSNVWVGTAGGLVRVNRDQVSFDGGRGTTGPVTALYEDREGNLWVGSPRGIERLRDSAFVTYSVAGLQSESSGTVYVDEEGRAWFAPFEGGLHWLKGEKSGSVTNDHLSQDVVYSIAGSKSELWIGRQRGGLTHLRYSGSPVTTKTYTEADGLAQNGVYAVYQSHDGSVWAATLSHGVSKYRDHHFTTYTTANGMASDTVASIAESPDGTMWFATPNGLNALSKGQWRVFTVSDGMPSDDVNCLLSDSSGMLWIGTVSGLAFLRAGRVQVPSQAPASLREQILGIAEDRSGRLWIATSNHVLAAKRHKLLGGALSSADVREYGLEDGLLGTEGVRRHQSVFADPFGRVWFSMNRGVSVVDTTRAVGSSAPAIVQIEGLSFDGNSSDLRRPVRIPPGGHRVTFIYSGLSLSVPERVRFKYKLEGADEGWSDPVAVREATYNNLGPGSYRFRLIASNSDGVWNSSESTLQVEIAPAFWQTWWFRLVSAVFILVSIWLLYKLRIRNMAERERQFRKLAENAPDIVMRFDPGLRYSYVNPIVEEYTGLAPKALLGRTNQEVGMSAKNVQSWEAALREVFSTGRATMKEFTFDTPKAQRHFESRLVPEVGAVGSTKSVLAITRDITDRKRALEALRRSEAYLGEAQKLSQTGSFGWDVCSGEIYWSRETFRIFEYDPTAKVTIELVVQRTHPEDRSAVQEIFERVSRERSEFDFEHRLLMPDGSVKYVRVVGRPSIGERDCFEFVGAVTDVTERKRSDEERERLRQAQADLAHVTRVTTMGELTASLAHEVNQPIAAAITNSNTCLRWLAREPPNVEEAREAASRSVKDATRAADIISRIRLLFKKGTPLRESVDVNEVTREVIVLLRDEADRYSVAIRADLAADLPEVMADRVQLQQVFMNLMLNGIEAIKDTNAAGQLTIKSQRTNSGHLLISVSDTGVGLAPQQADQIFSAFFTTKPEGTGMGLPISRSIIESHGGRLWATANSGRGATFHFTLPSEVEGLE